MSSNDDKNDNDSTPAVEHTHSVTCRTCKGQGSYTPAYAKAIALIQQLSDEQGATGIEELIDDTIRKMSIKKSRRPHIRRLLQKFCDLAKDYD